MPCCFFFPTLCFFFFGDDINPTVVQPRFVLPGVAESFSTGELMTVSGQNFHGRSGRRKSALGLGRPRDGWDRSSGGMKIYPSTEPTGKPENHRLKFVPNGRGYVDMLVSSQEGT